jgi:hypothetical protein
MMPAASYQGSEMAEGLQTSWTFHRTPWSGLWNLLSAVREQSSGQPRTRASGQAQGEAGGAPERQGLRPGPAPGGAARDYIDGGGQGHGQVSVAQAVILLLGSKPYP